MIFKMKRVPIDDATDEQIGEYCMANGLDVDDGMTRAGLMALLSSVHDKPWVLAPDIPDTINDAFAAQIEEITSGPQQRLEGGIGANDPKVRLKVSKTSYPGGALPVPVSVNGVTVVIQRDMTVDLPYRYYHALENAVYQEVTQADFRAPLVFNDVTNYPVNVLIHPPAEEVRAWRERIDSELLPA